jgi:hypothetical protein
LRLKRAQADVDGATRQRVMDLVPKLLFVSAGEWRGKTRVDIKAGAYAVETLEAALWAVWQADGFRGMPWRRPPVSAGQGSPPWPGS